MQLYSLGLWSSYFNHSVLALPTILHCCFSQQTSWWWDKKGNTKNGWVTILVLMVISRPKLLLLAMSGTMVLLQLVSVLMSTVSVNHRGSCKLCAETCVEEVQGPCQAGSVSPWPEESYCPPTTRELALPLTWGSGPGGLDWPPRHTFRILRWLSPVSAPSMAC